MEECVREKNRVFQKDFLHSKNYFKYITIILFFESLKKDQLMVFFVLDLDGGQNLCQKYRYARDDDKKHDFSLC